jgi:transposase
MRAYPRDLRVQVFEAWRASGDAEAVAARFGVSRAFVFRLIQRFRATASLAPKTPPTRRVLVDQEPQLRVLMWSHATLAELQVALSTTASRSTLCRELKRLGCITILGVRVPPVRPPST